MMKNSALLIVTLAVLAFSLLLVLKIKSQLLTPLSQ